MEKREIVKNIFLQALRELTQKYAHVIDKDSFLKEESEHYYQVNLSFSGPLEKGSLHLSCTGRLGQELTTIILGIEDCNEIPQEDAKDILGELLNTVAGQYIFEAYKSEDKLELGLPETQEISYQDFRTFAESQDVSLIKVDPNHPLVIWTE